MAFLLSIIKLLTINVLYIQLLVVILQRFKNINMGEFKKYKLPDYRIGIDDLKNHYAFSYRATGEYVDTNDVERYKSSDGWLGVNESFKDIDYLNQDEVDKRSSEISLENDNRVSDLIKSGEYGKMTSGGTISIQHAPYYDDFFKVNQDSKLSYRFDIIDLNKSNDR